MHPRDVGALVGDGLRREYAVADEHLTGEEVDQGDVGELVSLRVDGPDHFAVEDDGAGFGSGVVDVRGGVEEGWVRWEVGVTLVLEPLWMLRRAWRRVQRVCILWAVGGLGGSAAAG